MTNSMSLSIWILLVVSIGIPVHLLVNKGTAHWREHGEISAIVTLTLAMVASGSHLMFSLAAGLLFGTPIGLIFRAMVHAQTKRTR